MVDAVKLSQVGERRASWTGSEAGGAWLMQSSFRRSENGERRGAGRKQEAHD